MAATTPSDSLLAHPLIHAPLTRRERDTLAAFLRQGRNAIRETIRAETYFARTGLPQGEADQVNRHVMGLAAISCEIVQALWALRMNQRHADRDTLERPHEQAHPASTPMGGTDGND